MGTIRVPASRLASRRLGALAAMFIVTMSLGGALAACSDHAATPAATDTAAATPGHATMAPDASADQARALPEVPVGAMTMPSADEVTTAWAARPDYVKALPAEGQAAYAFALARPDVLQWLPCYCGCTGIEHRSNLDCYFVRREVKSSFAYEEHASYCDICIQTANMASAMIRQGSTMTQVRAAVDAQFGSGAAPGTVTPLPPES